MSGVAQSPVVTERKPKSIAELKKSPHVKQATADVEVCLSTDLASEFDALNNEFLKAVSDEDAEARKPQRLGSKGGPAQKRTDEVSARMDALIEKMAEHQVTIHLGGKTAGEWNLWKADHQPREDSKRDKAKAYDLCDFDALVTAIPDFLLTLNGDPYIPLPEDAPADAVDDWRFVADTITASDLDKAATGILTMFEGSFQIPFSRASWLADRRSSRVSGPQTNEE